MKRIALFLCAVMMAFAFCSCKTPPEPDFDFVPKEEDKLTKKEVDALVWHATQFVANSKKLRLKKMQRDFIRNQRPEVKIKYFAPKYGQVRMTWVIADNATVEIYGTGELTESNHFPWRLEVKIFEDDRNNIKEKAKKLSEEE